MADIELVIKVPEDLYKATINDLDANEIWNLILAVKNCTPLPKGHGDLVDYEEMKNNAREYGAYAEATLSHIKPKTIIEANK